ncbi:MAG: DUF370 domain-containing protein [Clostridia bacterium]|nr:DUF370 domain-containing protein [Clostridia bacterium]
MYLHIGNDESIPLREIIAIIDLDTVASSLPVQELLDIAQRNGKLVSPVGGSKPKSCIITDQKYYLSTISALTLARRVKQWGMDEEVFA